MIEVDRNIFLTQEIVSIAYQKKLMVGASETIELVIKHVKNIRKKKFLLRQLSKKKIRNKQTKHITYKSYRLSKGGKKASRKDLSLVGFKMGEEIRIEIG